MENKEFILHKTNETQPLTRRKKLLTIAVLSLALTIIILDTTLLNVSLATIIRDFKTTIQNIQWVITAYSLTLAALTITGGRLGDFFGRKRMFVVGAIVFAIGSFITSISQNIPTMIIGESIIEGIGAALMMPATSSLLMSNFRGRERALAFGIWGGIAGGAAALGPIVGGFLATNYSWRWGFRLNVFVVLLLVIGSFFIPEAKEKEEKPEMDWLGVILSSVGLLALVFGAIESSTYGWWHSKQALIIAGHQVAINWNLSPVPFVIIEGLIFLAFFVSWELHRERVGKTPLVSMKLFRNWQFSSGVLTTSVLSLAQSGIIFSIPVFLQAVRGYTALQTGFALLPMSLALLVIAPLGALISSKIPPKYIVNFGLFVDALGMWVLRQGITVHATAWNLAPGLILFGVGMGIAMSQISNLTLSAVSVEEAGEASGVNTTLRQVGSSFGSAIIGAILLGALATNLVNGVNQSTVIPGEVKPAISQAISNQTSNVEFGGGAKVGKQLPPHVSQEIEAIGHQATVDANKQALNYGVFFAFLGFLASLTLPNVKDVEKSQSVAAGH